MHEKVASTSHGSQDQGRDSDGTPRAQAPDPDPPRKELGARSADGRSLHAASRLDASPNGRGRRSKLASLTRLAAISPRTLYRALSRPDMLGTKLQKPRESSVRDYVQFLFGRNPDVAARHQQYHREFVADHRFFHELNVRMVERRDRRVWGMRWGELMYLVVRFHRPTVVIETGVFDGISSSVILKALADNGHGRLHSIDLPAVSSIEGSTDRMVETTLPPGLQPGWVVPDYLRDRYDLTLGDARVELPGLLARVKTVDLFLHDSLHTFDHMDWEFRTAWPYLPPGALLMSDDIFWNSAFHRFARAQGRPYRHFRNLGGLRK
jgi:hypothetical protein